MQLIDTIHAGAVAVGDLGLLVCGPSGSGKSGLAARMLASWPFGVVRLVADDRVRLTVAGGKLIGRPHPVIAGRMELRGYAIQTVPWLESVVIRGCIDLSDRVPDRLPDEGKNFTTLLGQAVPCLRLKGGEATFSALVTVWPYFRDEMLKV